MASRISGESEPGGLAGAGRDSMLGSGITRRRFVQQAGVVGVSAVGVGAFAPGALAWGDKAKLSHGPLVVSRANPRYLADRRGSLVYLAGAETWGNGQNGFSSTAFGYGWGDPFQERAFLDMMSANDLNYIRLWLYETPFVTYFGGQAGQPDDRPRPVPWLRTGPGTAFDGKPKFDLTKIDPAYLALLRSRIEAAARREIYVSVMLFEGFSVLSPQAAEDLAGWAGHPFNAANNINGINGDPDATGQGIATHTLQIPAVTRLQDMYIRTVLDAFNDLDNIMSYEVANESFGTPEWEYHVIDTIKQHEAHKPKQHLTYMSFVHSDTTHNEILFESSAAVIAVGGSGTSVDNPVEADGSKVLVSETDHIGPTFTALQLDAPRARAWAWRAFTRGNNPSLEAYAPNQPGFDEGVRAMGDTRRFAARINLVALTPHSDLSSTGNCLADPGAEYLAYQPGSGAFTLDLVPGRYRLEWFDPSTGNTVDRAQIIVNSNAAVDFTPPFSGDAVLHLKA
jgi:Family of unknown function (DUF6298)